MNHPAMDHACMTHAQLHQLLAWCSPAYPTGAFSYSHGLEWAVESRLVHTRWDVIEYITAMLARGGGWVDAVLFAHAWRAAASGASGDMTGPGDTWPEGGLARLLDVAELAAAFRGSPETALESRQQGSAFLEVTLRAWPHPRLSEFARALAQVGDTRVTQPVAMAAAAAVHGLPLLPALQGFLHATASNLVSAAARLVPLGQSDAQVAVAKLCVVADHCAARAVDTDLGNLGTCAPLLEVCSVRHETQYTRLFRS